MKFLIINRATGVERGAGYTVERAHDDADTLKELLDSGRIEAAYVLISGGHAYIAEAGDTEELAKLVRKNPLFKRSETEIIPIADALEFLKGYAKALGVPATNR